jgi:putative ABC transport system permease protein
LVYPTVMTIKYLQMALRNLRNNKTFSFLNILGFGIGIACAALIFLWVEDEMDFDANNLKKDRIFLVKMNAKMDAGMFTHSSTPGPLAEALQTTVPGIASTCRVTEGLGPMKFNMGDNAVYASGIYVEPAFFKMFTLPFVQGNAQAAFSQLHSIVITETTAKKFFGDDKNIIGKSIRSNDKQDYIVSGVLKDLPKNSTIQFEWLAPFQIFYLQNDWLKRWNNFGLTTYVELKQGIDPAIINKQLSDPYYDFTTQKKEATVSTDHVYLFGMNHWRLYNDFDNGKETGSGRIQYVHLFSLIAWIILFIACINFMNLSTARSEKRAREVGVRKVLGAGKTSLILQFVGEALFMSLLAMLAAIILMSLALPLFNQLVQKDLSLGLNIPYHWLSLLVLTLICGLVAGSYPSFYLSSFNPVFVLKGMKIKTGNATIIRKGLVVLQFTISIILIIGTVVIDQQIKHIKNRDIGYNKEHLIQMNVNGSMQKNFESIKQEFIQTGLIENIALADHATLTSGNNTTSITWPGKNPNSQIVISQRLVSPEFMITVGMKIIEGRDFETSDIVKTNDHGRPLDTNSIFHVIITSSMAKLLGKGSAIGKTLEHVTNSGDMHLLVEGVVKDYLYGDMYSHESSPVIFYAMPQATNLLYVRTKTNARPDQLLTKMEEILKHENPGYPFEYQFVDDQFNNLFQSEMLIGKLSGVFTALAIAISCLGLFGLAAYTAERRIKEIGIRKVLGAGVFRISRLLSKEFLQLVSISCLIAFPIAWWVMQKWLQNYAYHISISWWIFIVAGLLAILIALITVSFQAIKAAIANPIEALRTN